MTEPQQAPTPTTRKPLRKLRLLFLLMAAGAAFGFLTIFGSWWLIQREASFTFDQVEDERKIGCPQPVPHGGSPVITAPLSNLRVARLS